MNRYVIAGAVAVVTSGVLFFACGGGTPGPCTVQSTAASTLQTKWGSCDAGAGINPFQFLHNCTNTSGCSTAYNQCTAAEQTVLTAQAACITNMPSCTAGVNDTTWFGALSACSLDAGSVSATCTGYFTAQNPDGGC